MTDIVAFLTARLDEDELLAREATPGPWAPERPMLTDVVTSELLGRVADCSVGTRYRPQSLEDARHISRHNPDRVLRDVAAKRRILAESVPAMRGLEDGMAYEYSAEPDREASDRLLRLLAEPYAEHPNYDPAWAVA